MTRAYRVVPGGPLGGRLEVPGDKSISHRSLMLGALAEGPSSISGFLAGADCLATLAALRAMGVAIDQPAANEVRIQGVGLRGLQAPGQELDMGNSGTAMRLFMGLLAGQSFDSTLIGDASLTRRPMERVAKPLREMGAAVVTRDGCPPVQIRGGRPLSGIDYAMPVASAQVKSAILLAGLYAQGETAVVEPAVTRDHTERMLRQFGVPVRREGPRIRLRPGAVLRGGDVHVPGDLSSAAFFLLAACTVPGSDIEIGNVGLNPTRIGVLRILKLMGADIEVQQRMPSDDGEPVGQLRIRHARLQGIAVPPELVPLAIDEFPVIFMAAALASGVTTISGAAELRHKESDRIGAMAAGLKALGIEVEERPDGARIVGGRPQGGTVNCAGDHRIAMAFAMGAAAAQGPVEILDTRNVDTSFPGFVDAARQVGLNLEVHDDERA